MTKSINQVVILGRLGADPEVRSMPNSDKFVANFSVATNENWTDKGSGERKQQTEWHLCVAYNRNAEIIRDYVKKGEVHHFTGRLKTRKWTDANNVERYTTEVIIDDIILLPQAQKAPN